MTRGIKINEVLILDVEVLDLEQGWPKEFNTQSSVLHIIVQKCAQAYGFAGVGMIQEVQGTLHREDNNGAETFRINKSQLQEGMEWEEEGEHSQERKRHIHEGLVASNTHKQFAVA